MVAITSKWIAPVSHAPLTPDDLHDFTRDFLRGADEIKAFLIEIGFQNATSGKVYYWAKTKRFPIAKLGNELVASKAKILRETRKLIA